MNGSPCKKPFRQKDRQPVPARFAKAKAGTTAAHYERRAGLAPIKSRKWLSLLPVLIRQAPAEMPGCDGDGVEFAVDPGTWPRLAGITVKTPRTATSPHGRLHHHSPGSRRRSRCLSRAGGSLPAAHFSLFAQLQAIASPARRDRPRGIHPCLPEPGPLRPDQVHVVFVLAFHHCQELGWACLGARGPSARGPDGGRSRKRDGYFAGTPRQPGKRRAPFAGGACAGRFARGVPQRKGEIDWGRTGEGIR